jgi:nucleoid-associated protein YejK
LGRAQKYDFRSYVTVDCDVATSGVSTVEELCGAYASTRSVEDKKKEDESVQDMVASFAETYEALEKVKAFFYVHSVTDADLEHILGLEKSFSIESKFCHEAKDNVRLLLLKNGFPNFSFSPLP